jgi:hypothetical protein
MIKYPENIMIQLNENPKPKIKKNISNILNTYIPTVNDIFTLKNHNFTIIHLKYICKHYKLKISGIKSELIERIHNYLWTSYNSIIIQKYFRGHIIIYYFKLLGPALTNRTICKNNTDFFTLEELKDIPFSQFFSYKQNNNIWGFNIISIYNLFIINNNKEIYNPYTRETITYNIFDNIIILIKLSKIVNQPIHIILNNDNISITAKKKNEFKCLELFQIINQLGNYSDYRWFMNLNKYSLLRFIKELIDIWNYRAELSFEVKLNICYPSGNPFILIDMCNINTIGFIRLQKIILSIIKQLITLGTSQEYCNLGASYVLCALTLVCTPAAEALPWLYNSVYNNT